MVLTRAFLLLPRKTSAVPLAGGYAPGVLPLMRQMLASTAATAL